MVAGDQVSDYSKRPGRSSILGLRLERVNDLSSHRLWDKKWSWCKETGEEMEGARRGQGHWEAEARTMKSLRMRVGRALSASVVARWNVWSEPELSTPGETLCSWSSGKLNFFSSILCIQSASRSNCVPMHTHTNVSSTWEEFRLHQKFNCFQKWPWFSVNSYSESRTNVFQ